MMEGMVLLESCASVDSALWESVLCICAVRFCAFWYGKVSFFNVQELCLVEELPDLYGEQRQATGEMS